MHTLRRKSCSFQRLSSGQGHADLQATSYMLHPIEFQLARDKPTHTTMCLNTDTHIRTNTACRLTQFAVGEKIKLKLKAKIASVLGSSCSCSAVERGRWEGETIWVGEDMPGAAAATAEVSLRLAARQHLPRNDFQKCWTQLGQRVVLDWILKVKVTNDGHLLTKIYPH